MPTPPESVSPALGGAEPASLDAGRGSGVPALGAAQVGEVVAALVKALRAHQMYQENNPVYQRFVTAAQQAFAGLWAQTAALHLAVEEGGLRWEDQTFPAGEGRETLAFQLFKDGIRMVTFLPGFEEEVAGLLEVLHRGRQSRSEADDLITLLWERDFTAFQYSFVDLLADGLVLPEPSGIAVAPVSRAEVAEDAAEGRPAQAQEPPSQQIVPAITRDDFEETLFFLDESELAQLQVEVDREWSRDTKRDVLNALFDRIADPIPERQLEILRMLRQIMASSLSQGDMRSAALILRELDGVAARPDTLGEAQRTLVERLFNELGEPEVLGQLIQLLEAGQIEPDAADLSHFFRHLRPGALPILIQGAESTVIAGVRDRLQAAIDPLARDNAELLASIFEAKDPVLVRGAARLVSRLKMTAAAAQLGRLMEHGDPSVRIAAIEAIVAAPSGPGMEALVRGLEDGERDVRVAAARGLGQLRYRPARPRLEAVVQGRSIRDADTTEKITFFEAYGLVGGADAVALLDKLLNGRGLLGRRQPAEVRACAALGLGRVATPAARAALQQAADEPDPVIRNAIGRALRQEAAQ